MNCNGGSSLAGECRPSSSMDKKPIITCAGNVELFSTLENNLLQAIPADAVEWRRSFSRPVKQVKLGALFVPFSRDILPKEKNWRLIEQPIFHIYWTDCSDVDTYKTSIRDDIDNWLKILAANHIQDWMVVVVETYDTKKGNKLLPRTTVIDKIRSDFASKNFDRCISVINPIKSESRSAESWRGLIGRIRFLMLSAYDRTLSGFEDIIREQRERRNNPNWNFCHYFLLQEELAFALQMLGLYDEALVQYDELDALFTQFVLNSNVGDTPAWLSLFQTPLNNWAGVNLNSGINHHLRYLLAECKASLLDLRSYLFSRQCAMLLLLNKPWEVAQRCLSFVQNTISELRILEVQRPEGSIECWSFLCALEVLQACQLSVRVNIDNNQQLDLCSLHTASLWALARDKLGDLGKLCGLMPGNEPTSEQLHTVVYLIAGMGDPETQVEGKLTPIDKLKEALSSKEAFKKQYLEHAELAMGTYKHIGRIRSARLIGKELARFYSELGENQKAVAFLSDALKTYMDEGWYNLAAQTQLELAQCYKRMDDVEKYTKICAAIASTNSLHVTVRNTYFEEMLGYMKMISSSHTLLTELAPTFTILSMEVEVMDKVVQDCMVSIKISLQSSFPREVNCTSAAISVEEIQKPSLPNKKKNAKTPEPQIPLLSRCTIDDMKPIDPTLLQLETYSYLNYTEDRSLGSATVQSKNMKPVIKRSDSAKHRKPSVNVKGDFSTALTCKSFVINPGTNIFALTRRVDQPGFYKVGQLSLTVEDKLEFLSPILNPQLCYEVAKTQPTINIKCGRDLLAGLTQDIQLIISSGSTKITNEMKLKLRTSRGLVAQVCGSDKEMAKELEIALPACEPFQTIKLQLKVLAELPPKKDSSSMEHKLNIQCPWDSEENVLLHFGPPLMSSMKLHTAKQRKFLQIIVTGLTAQLLQLTEPQLATSTSIDVNFKSLNPVAGQKLVIGNGMNVSFMWEMDIGKDEKSTVAIKTDFRVKYMPISDNDNLSSRNNDDPLHIQDLQKLETECSIYRCNFDITDYMTLFMVSSKVEAGGGGGEFCRAGSMCHLCLTVTRMLPTINSSPPPQLMYEVLADQAMWAICGRTAGIVSLEVLEKQSVTLDVMPLTSGYLPLPVVRLSRYIPAVESKNDIRKNDAGSSPRLEPFSPGQVYNASKAQQVHVLPAAPSESN